MAHIALQMAEPFLNTRDDQAERAFFAVCHVYGPIQHPRLQQAKTQTRSSRHLERVFCGV